jgi:hypothetical protein
VATPGAWPCLIPQHGPGRKHERKIELVDWQRDIVDEHPRGGIFCRACDQLGVAWRQPKERTISIARAQSVALLDTFVGPKT